MRNLFLTCIGLFLAVFNLHAQADSIAKTTVKINAINDSVYAVKVGVQLQPGWKVYDVSAEDGLEAPSFQFTLETALAKNKPQFSIASVTQSDPLFTNAKVFKSNFDISQEILINGFQPDSLKGETSNECC